MEPTFALTLLSVAEGRGIEMALIGAAVGFLLGLMGGGGAMLAVPALVYVGRLPPLEAVGLSLAVVGATSAVGAFLKWRRGQVHAGAAFVFAVSGALGAAGGAHVAHAASPEALMLSFAVLMFGTAGHMLRRQDRDRPPPQAACRPVRCAAAGLSVGALTGFLGVGGGVLIVPAMVRFADIPLKTAMGASLAVIAANSAAGLWVHGQSGRFDGALAALFAAAAMAGLLGGLAAADRLPARALNQAFAWLAMAIAVALAAENGRVLFEPATK